MHEWPESLGTPPEELREFDHINHGVMNYTLLMVRSDAIVDALIDRLIEMNTALHDMQARDKYSQFTVAQCRSMLQHAAEQFQTLGRTAPELIEDWRAAVAEEGTDDEA